MNKWNPDGEQPYDFTSAFLAAMAAKIDTEILGMPWAYKQPLVPHVKADTTKVPDTLREMVEGSK